MKFIFNFIFLGIIRLEKKILEEQKKLQLGG
jgi:hypothetical protein